MFAFPLGYVAMPIPNFISLEVGNLIDTILRRGFLATLRPWASIAMFGMKTVIYVAPEVFRTVKPLAGADEDTARKPLRTIVAVRSTVIGRDVIVAIGAVGRSSNLHRNLRRCFWSGYQHEASGDSRQRGKLESSHKPSLVLWGLHEAPPGYSP